MGNNTICSNIERKRKTLNIPSVTETSENNHNNNIIGSENMVSNNNIIPSNSNSNITSISTENTKKEGKFTFKGEKSFNLIVHRNDGMNDYVIEMTLSKCDKTSISKQAEFIMILDVSGSMSSYVHNLITNIIPRALNLLNYRDNDIIHLITFQSISNLYEMTIGQLKADSSIQGSGGTCMAGVYQLVKSILNNNNNKKNYRILVLSDGIIADQEKTKNEAEVVKNFLSVNDYSISVGSIRYGTTYSQQGDTKALSSVLMLNTDTTKERVLTEVSSSDPNEQVSQKIYELFKDDYFISDFSIKSDKIKFRIDPWEKGSNNAKLKVGKNIIFADKNPSIEDVGIFEDGKLKYKKEDFRNGYELNYSNYNALLGAKINMTARKVKINKTSGSQAALEENKKIINYYENFEKKLIGNKDNEALISKELKTINELDINKYDNNQIAQFIGVDNNMIPITDFLKDYLQIDDKDEDNINDFTKKVFEDGLMIDKAFEKLYSS